MNVSRRLQMNWKNYNYKTEGGHAILLEYQGEESCVKLPEEINGFPVTELSGDAFFMTVVERLVIPSTITEIVHPFELGSFFIQIAQENPVYHTDGYGLYEQRGEEKILTAVCRREEREDYEVEAGTTVIGMHAFEGQEKLKTVYLPDGVCKIQEAAFGECLSLQKIQIPEGVTEIAEDAFHRCVSLRTVHLPASLKILGKRALTDTFGWSDQLNGIQKITVADANPIFHADSEAFYEGDTLVKYFGQGERFFVPEGTKIIGASAFRRSRLQYIRIPDSVQEVQKEAFRECTRIRQIEIQGDDTLLYIPQIPVYRKDEVLSCFRQADAVVKKQSWRTDPIYSNRFAKQYLSEYGGEGNLEVCEPLENDAATESRIYDYRAYDALVDTYARLDERCHMACFRLSYPIDLSREYKEKYQKMLEKHFSVLLEEIAKQENINFLSELTQIGYFTEHNIDAACEIMNQNHCTKLMGYLMEYKQEHFGMAAFDFSL